MNNGPKYPVVVSNNYSYAGLFRADATPNPNAAADRIAEYEQEYGKCYTCRERLVNGKCPYA